MNRNASEGSPSDGDASRHGGRASLQAPWSRGGWYTNEYYASRDANLDEKVGSAGRGLNPYGYYEDRPGLAISPVMHNPYFSFVLAAIFGWLGWFLFDKLHGTLWLAITVTSFFELVAVLGIVVPAFRIPGWHRARRVAKAHVAAHGGTFPPELRWYT